jgi:hypothetical protein
VSGSGGPAQYEIRIEGVLDSRWADWFGVLHVQSDGRQTVISGLLADQPALHGLLVKVRDLGLCLISVQRLDPDEAGADQPALHGLLTKVRDLGLCLISVRRLDPDEAGKETQQ